MISMDKRYRTRDGRPVRVLCVDRNAAMRVVALIQGVGVEDIHTYNKDGRFSVSDNDLDLIELPELEFDWSCLPKWATGIKLDHSRCFWIWSEGQDRMGTIPPAYAPRYHGSDPAQIFQRPTEEAK